MNFIDRLKEINKQYETGEIDASVAYIKYILLSEKCGEMGSEEEINQFNRLASRLEEKFAAGITD